MRDTLQRVRSSRMIVLGDMNATMREEEDGEIKGANDNGERMEAWTTDFGLNLQNWRWNQGERGTWCGSPLSPPITIDWIATSLEVSAEVRGCRVVELQAETDHRMVMADVEWCEGKKATGRTKFKRMSRKSCGGEDNPVEAARMQLNEVQKRAKKAVEEDKQKYWEKLSEEVEKAAQENNMAAVFRAIRPFYRKRPKQMGFKRPPNEMEEGLEHFRRLLTRSQVPPVEPIALLCQEKFESRPPARTDP